MPLEHGQRQRRLTEEDRIRRRAQLASVRVRRWANRPEPQRWVMSFSGGKDSTAMLHVILRTGLPLDDVIFFDSGWEFPEVYAHLELVKRNTGMSITMVRPRVAWQDRLARWGWPHWRRRWCTGDKGAALDRHTRACGKYVGLAFDERARCAKYLRSKTQVQHVRFPLVDAGMTTGQAMEFCRAQGYTWGGLYEVFPRFSCFCCPLQSLSTIRKLATCRPALFARLCAMHDAMPEARRKEGWKKGRSPSEALAMAPARVLPALSVTPQIGRAHV